MTDQRAPVTHLTRARLVVITAAAMVAFAGNSVLTRAALDGDDTDPGTFSLIRLAAGAAALAVILAGRGRPAGARRRSRSWLSAGALLGYVVCFSFAYVTLGAATGALVLFGVVQAVILSVALRRGERPGPATWCGLLVALAGLLVLVGPGLDRPDPGGAALMAAAGIAWAVYTLRGRSVSDPTAATAANFALAVPAAAVVWLGVVLWGNVRLDATGFALAAASGALTSALGYALWYSAVPHLSRASAGLVQLSPAPLASIGGLVVLGEPLTGRVVLATMLILGGVAVGLVGSGRR